MVILRPAVLVLAATFGVMLGLPAVTSPPTGFVSSADKAREPSAASDARSPLPATVPANAAQGVLQVPAPPVLLALLRGTLAAVNQANVTGNYSVLRDLGSPNFRENYNAAELADRFRPWRENALDFAAILLLDAKLSRAPEIDGHGVLRLAGFFPTAPLRIGFDLGFEAVGGNWRLSTISVDARTLDAESAGASAAGPAPLQHQTRAENQVPAPVVVPAPVAQATGTSTRPRSSGPAPSQVAPFSAGANPSGARPQPFSMMP